VDRASNRALYTPINANEMSLTRIGTVIKNPFAGKAITTKALVDTGATLTVVPRRIAEELQLPVIGRRRVVTAKGTTELDECVGVVEMTPSPSQRGGVSLWGSRLLPPLWGLLKTLVELVFINLSHVVGQPALKGET